MKSRYKLRTCLICKKELNRHQIKYCSYCAMIKRLRDRKKWAETLTDNQLRHWFGLK